MKIQKLLPSIALLVMIMTAFCADNKENQLVDLLIPQSLFEGRIPPLHMEISSSSVGNKESRGYLAGLIHAGLKYSDQNYLINYYTAEQHVNESEHVLALIEGNTPWETRVQGDKTLYDRWIELLKARSWIENTIAQLICTTEYHANSGLTTIKYEDANKLRRLLAANRHILSPDTLRASRNTIETFTRQHGEKAFFPDNFSSILRQQKKSTPSNPAPSTSPEQQPTPIENQGAQ